MTFTDTHAHLYADAFDEDREAILQRAEEAGVSRLFLPNIDQTSIEGMLQLADQYPDRCFPMMGLHPCSVNAEYRQELDLVKTWLDKRDFCAIGEIGLDFYWDITYKAEQERALREQFELAIAYDLPVVLHTRDSIPETIAVVREMQHPKLRGVFHCFTGTLEEAQQIINLNFMLGIGGVFTFKKSHLPEVVQELDLQHLVLETDAPYLAPTPHRGKRNESAYVPLVAAKLAEVKHTSVENVAEITTANSLKLFGI